MSKPVDYELVGLMTFGLAAAGVVISLPVLLMQPLYGAILMGGILVGAGAFAWRLLPQRKTQPKTKRKTALALEYADQHEGLVTIADLIREYNMSITEAECTLEMLVEAGALELSLDQEHVGSGNIVYRVSAPKFIKTTPTDESLGTFTSTRLTE